MFRKSIAALMAVVTLAACAVPGQPVLDAALAGCNAGNQQDCERVPYLQSQVAYEKQVQGEKVAAGILLGIGAAAAGAAAGYAATHPTYYYEPTVVVVCRHRWRC